MKTAVEWKEVSRWYPFSVRVLVTATDTPEWHEQARCSSWDQAREIMHLLGRANEGKEGTEKPVSPLVSR